MHLLIDRTRGRGWRRHTCVQCGTQFLNRLPDAYAEVGGMPPEQARRNLEHALARHRDVAPCPQCGIYQPLMLWHRTYSLQQLAIAVVVPASIGLLAVLAGRSSPMSLCDLESFRAAQLDWPVVVQEWPFWLLMPLLPIGVAIFLGLQCFNPNRNTHSNWLLAQQGIQSGGIVVEESDDSQFPGPATVPTRPPVLGPLLLMLAGVACLLLPLGVRRQQGWQLNDAFKPAVVGPGDAVPVALRARRSSLKGFWRATAEAAARNWNDLGLPGPALDARGRFAAWERTIYVEKETTDEGFRPWVTLQIPDRAELAGKTLEADLHVSLTCPQPVGQDRYRNVNEALAETTTIRISPRGAGLNYQLLCWLGAVLGGVALSTAAIWLIARMNAFYRRRHATEIVLDDSTSGAFPSPPIAGQAP